MGQLEMSDTLTILSLGCGNMGAALLSGMLARFPQAQVIAVDPSVARAQSLLPDTPRARVVASLAEAGDVAPDLTLIAVKPQQFQDLAATAGFAERLASGVTVSIMAGTPLATLASLSLIPTMS